MELTVKQQRLLDDIVKEVAASMGMTDRQRKVVKVILNRVLYSCAPTNEPGYEAVNIGTEIILLDYIDKKAVEDIAAKLVPTATAAPVKPVEDIEV